MDAWRPAKFSALSITQGSTGEAHTGMAVARSWLSQASQGCPCPMHASGGGAILKVSRDAWSLQGVHERGGLVASGLCAWLGVPSWARGRIFSISWQDEYVLAPLGLAPGLPVACSVEISIAYIVFPF